MASTVAPMGTDVMEREPDIGDNAAVEVTFEFEVDGLRAPSARQMQWLFERLHEADVVTAQWLLTTKNLSASRDEAEYWLLTDPAAPYVAYVLYENPFRVKKVIAGLVAATALMTATGAALEAGADVIRDAGDVIEAVHHVREQVQHFSTEDPQRVVAQAILDGEGHDPRIRIVAISGRPVD